MALNYIERGEAERTPLIMIHAFPLEHTMWRYQLEDLSDMAWMVAPDLPGFGDSSPLETEPSMAAYAQAIKQFMQERQIQKAVWAGCSLGGYILFELWRQAPETIVGMILCDTRAEADNDEARANRMEAIQSVQTQGTSVLAQNMPAKLLGKTTQKTRPDIVEEVTTIIHLTEPQAVIQAQQAMAERPDSFSLLPKINCPTLVLVGEEDNLTPPNVALNMAAGIPNARIEVIPKAGHLCPWEQPEYTNRVIRSFLEEHHF